MDNRKDFYDGDYDDIAHFYDDFRTINYIVQTLKYKDGQDKKVKSAEASLKEAVSYVHKKNFAEAINIFNKIIQLFPCFSSDCIFRQGLEYFQDKEENWDRSIQLFTRAIRLYPKQADYYFVRGKVYSLAGKEGLAIQDFTQAIQLDPEDAFAYAARGHIFQHQGNIKNAAQDYILAISTHPVFIKKNQNEKALYLLEKTTEYACDEITVLLLKAALDKETKLGAPFWAKQSFFSAAPSLEKDGALKMLQNALNKIENASPPAYNEGPLTYRQDQPVMPPSFYTDTNQVLFSVVPRVPELQPIYTKTNVKYADEALPFPVSAFRRTK